MTDVELLNRLAAEDRAKHDRVWAWLKVKAPFRRETLLYESIYRLAVAAKYHTAADVIDIVDPRP